MVPSSVSIQVVTELNAVAIPTTDAIASSLFLLALPLLCLTLFNICCILRGVGASRSVLSKVLADFCVLSS